MRFSQGLPLDRQGLLVVGPRRGVIANHLQMEAEVIHEICRRTRGRALEVGQELLEVGAQRGEIGRDATVVGAIGLPDGGLGDLFKNGIGWQAGADQAAELRQQGVDDGAAIPALEQAQLVQALEPPVEPGLVRPPPAARTGWAHWAPASRTPGKYLGAGALARPAPPSSG